MQNVGKPRLAEPRRILLKMAQKAVKFGAAKGLWNRCKQMTRIHVHMFGTQP